MCVCLGSTVKKKKRKRNKTVISAILLMFALTVSSRLGNAKFFLQRHTASKLLIISVEVWFD